MNSYNNIELTQDIRELSILLKSKYNDELAEDKYIRIELTKAQNALCKVIDYVNIDKNKKVD
ncbi:hypothetical protein OUHCRE19_42960 [Enterobacter asburiae]|mgnify:FL=1